MVKERLQNTENRILESCIRSGRKREDVTVIAVTKTLSPDVINEALLTGLTHIGENRVQEYLGKRESLLPHTFHMIGHLQRNKVRQIISFVDLIHSVDSIELAEEISKRASVIERTVNVLIEVNTSNESSKHGVRPEQLIECASSILKFSHIRLKGLMTVAEYVEDPENVRESFRMLDDLRVQAQKEFPGEDIRELSMGMTNDFEVAIEEGATLIRLGTALFGART